MVSIVIPVHGRAALTAQCLAGLRTEFGRREDVDVIVVADGSDDETSRLLQRESHFVRAIEYADPAGFAASCNEGARAARGEYLVFLNNDVVGRPGWLESLVSYAEEDDRRAAVAAKLVYPNDTIQHAGMVFSSDLLPRHVYRAFPAGHDAVSRPRRFQAVSAACLLLRSSVFEQLEGFDPTFRNGFEDVDLCLRVQEAGYEVHYCPASLLVHFEAATRGENAEVFRGNSEHFLARWSETVVQDDVATYVEDGLLRIVPGDLYPLELEVDPLLATTNADGVTSEAFRLLGLRSRQVFELLKENTLLRVRLGEIEFEEAARELRADAATLRPLEC
jgi:GT2 family glycosyltransferase